MKDHNMSQDRLYIDGVDPRTTEIISQFLESQGYIYGYNGRPCERRAAHNMRFITINDDTKMFHGSKGAAVDVEWVAPTEIEIRDMLRYIKAKALHKEYQEQKRYTDLSGEVKSTALALNTNETLQNLQKEVMDEFVTSDREVYKAALRSLLTQEQKLNKQKASIDKDIDQLKQVRAALDESFKNGTLHSAEDARGVVRTVGKRAVSITEEFED